VARALRRAAPAGTIEVERGRWDQWQREEKLRARERAEHPDAVLRELERVLDERELRRVRVLAERGEVPAEHLDDLLRYRRPWAAEVDESDLPEFVRTA
jgi:vacuolar-type H+-ATPase subunit I/STV1